MNIKPIKTEADHRAALKTIESLMNAKPGTPEGAQLDAYEEKHYPMETPDPAEVVKFEMERKGIL